MSYFSVVGDVALTHEDDNVSRQATGPETTSMTVPAIGVLRPRTPGLSLPMVVAIGAGIAVLLLWMSRRKS